MSKAAPMSLVGRNVAYQNQNGTRRLTPRQRRRAVHKANRHEPSALVWRIGAKNRETPRRPRRTVDDA